MADNKEDAGKFLCKEDLDELIVLERNAVLLGHAGFKDKLSSFRAELANALLSEGRYVFPVTIDLGAGFEKLLEFSGINQQKVDRLLTEVNFPLRGNGEVFRNLVVMNDGAFDEKSLVCKHLRWRFAAIEDLFAAAPHLREITQHRPRPNWHILAAGSTLSSRGGKVAPALDWERDRNNDMRLTLQPVPTKPSDGYTTTYLMAQDTRVT